MQRTPFFPTLHAVRDFILRLVYGGLFILFLLALSGLGQIITGTM